MGGVMIQPIQPMAILRDLKECCLTLSRTAKMSPEELKGKIIVGEFVGG